MAPVICCAGLSTLGIFSALNAYGASNPSWWLSGFQRLLCAVQRELKSVLRPRIAGVQPPWRPGVDGKLRQFQERSPKIRFKT